GEPADRRAGRGGGSSVGGFGRLASRGLLGGFGRGGCFFFLFLLGLVDFRFGGGLRLGGGLGLARFGSFLFRLLLGGLGLRLGLLFRGGGCAVGARFDFEQRGADVDRVPLADQDLDDLPRLG